MSDKIYSISEIKDVVTPIATKYEVERVFLFGSYARGEASEFSDLDLMIDKGKIRGLKFAGMLGDLQNEFGKNVDLLTSSSLSSTDDDKQFSRRITRDMVMIYEH